MIFEKHILSVQQVPCLTTINQLQYIRSENDKIGEICLRRIKKKR